jgi:long-chain acyl-CoA synthetase
MAMTASELSPQRIRRIALGDVIHRSARRFGERTALIDGDQRLSYRRLDELSNRFAHHLLGLGLASGDRVGMLCSNSFDMVVAFLGVQKAGLVWVPINTTLAADSIGYILDHAEIRHLVIDAALLARPDLGELVRSQRIAPIVACPAGSAAPDGASTVAQAVAAGPTTLPDVEIDSNQLVLIMYTSGTTGKQKGVMHSHASVYAALMSTAVETRSTTGGDVWSGMLPLFHVAQFSLMMAALTVGATMLVQRAFDAAEMLEAIERHKVSIIFALPMMYTGMLTHPDRATRDLSSLRLCLYAMAPMPQTTLFQLLDEFCPNFALVSGQTEVFTPASIFAPEQQRQRFGAYWGVGTLVNEMAVMADDGRILGPGEGVGEIVFRGPNVMLGYYKDPEATAHVWRHGWHHTGDLGQIDADGQLLFMDRLKDMIKTGGENVPSIKVEEVLLRHPAVQNAAVVGLPHERWIEAIAAFVVLKPGAQATPAELIAHCKQHLGGFEVPKDVLLLDALPMTSTGKIQKFELRRANFDHFGTS